MRKISAHYVLSPNRAPLKNGILVFNEEGFLIDLVDTGGKLAEEESLEFYNGIIVPGFINAHCHTELSHFKNLIQPETGLTGFIIQIVDQRSKTDFSSKMIEDALKEAMDSMWRSGIQAIGDIVNTNDSLKAKLQSKLLFHSFVEVFGLDPAKSARIWEKAEALKKEFQNSGLKVSITPHAPYSLSKKLWENIHRLQPMDDPLSIHHQESQEENQFIRYRQGPLAVRFEQQNLPLLGLPAEARSSGELIMPYIHKEQKLLLVHNTFSSQENLEYILSKRKNKKTFFVLCPNANLYIEGTLPLSVIQMRDQMQICIGTDSLASNFGLSVFNELKTLSRECPELSLIELLPWATINGAEALGFSDQLGSFDLQKRPGAILIEGIDYKGFKIDVESRAKRIL